MTPSLLINTSSSPLVTRDGWIHIVPKGELPNRAAGVVQVLDDTALDAILRNLEADRTAKGDNWPGLYIGKEHFIYNDEKSSEAFGWMREFQKRDNGIWAKEDGLTDLGREAVANKRFKFTSFVAHRADTEPLGGNRLRVLKIDTVGFTNNPNGRQLLQPMNNRGEDIISNGDFPGHPFRGNQWADGGGGSEHSAASQAAHNASKSAKDKGSHKRAAKEHMRAAKLQRDNGNDEVADYHESMASFHDKRSSKLKNRDDFSTGTTPADETNNQHQTMIKTSQLLGVSADAGDEAFAGEVTKLKNRVADVEKENAALLGSLFDTTYKNRFQPEKVEAARAEFIKNRAGFEATINALAQPAERKDGNLLNRADAKPPGDKQESGERITNRAKELQSGGMSFEKAWAQATREVLK